MTTTFPYNLFIVTKNISLKNFETYNNCPKILTNISASDKASIFKIYEAEIKPKLDTIDNENLNNNNDSMIKLNDNMVSSSSFTVEEFSRLLFDTKYNYLSIQRNINNFNGILRKGNIEKNIIGKNISFLNPVIIPTIKPGISDKILSKIIDEKNDSKLIKQGIDNVYLGNRFNISLPSIGPIINIFNDGSKYNLSELMFKIINYKSNVKLSDYIPIIGQNINDILCKILIEKISNNMWNDIIIDNKSSNNKTYTFIKRYFNNVQSQSIIYDVLFQEKKVKKKYIIPYEVTNGSSSDPLDFTIKIISHLTPSHSSNDDKDTGINDFFTKTNEKIIFILKRIYETSGFNTQIETIMDKPNVKNLMVTYVFLMINLFYDIYKKYIDKLNDIIINLSSMEIGKSLNIKNAFEYIELLNTSLYNFKLILLNDFYNLFQPASYSKNNYGMEINKDGYFVPENNILTDNFYIWSNYPLQFKEIDNPNNKYSIANFMLLNKGTIDLYNSRQYLEMGVYIDNKTTKYLIQILNQYYNKITNKNNLNIFLTELLERYYKENFYPSLVIKLIEFIESKNLSQSTFKKEIQNFMSVNYRKYKLTSATYLIKVMQFDNEYKGRNLSENQYKKRNADLTISRIYNVIGDVYKFTTINSNIPSDVKNQLLDDFNKVINEINKKIAIIQKNYENRQASTIIKTSNSSSNSLSNSIKTKPYINIEYWTKLRDIIDYKQILVPFILSSNSNNILFVNILNIAIEGKYTDESIIELTNDSAYIILGIDKKSIIKGEFRVIDKVLDKLKEVKSENDIRRILYSLLTDITFYNKYSKKFNNKLPVYSKLMKFINEKPNNFNKYIISHSQIQKICGSM